MPTRSKSGRDLAPASIAVKAVETASLQPNPHNPRMLFDRLPLETLKSSIEKVGILVPLTVYKGGGQEKYTILDGQRRWICAQALGLPRVPVNQVAEPSLVQNIVTMFQIHKLREDWELMPTALKVEVLMEKLKERSDRKLAELTGLDQAVVTRCKKLLSYPPKYQERMLDPDPAKRVKADFFIELYPVRNDRTVNSFDWYSKDRFTPRMLEKYQNPASDLKAVTDFRVMKQHITNAVRVSGVPALSKRLREYTEDDAVPMSHLQIESANVAATARTFTRSVEKLAESVNAIDVERYYGEESLWDALERLLEVIRQKLKQADRRTKP